MRHKRKLAAALCLLCCAGIAAGVAAYFLLKTQPSVALSITALRSVSGRPLGRRALLHSDASFGGRRSLLQAPAALPNLGGRRSLLQTAPSALLNFSTAIQSSTASAFAQVDALILNVAYVRTASVAGGGHSLASTQWGVSKTLTLTPGLDAVPLTSSIEGMAPGAYMAADFVIWQRWSIQAFCRTANAFLYTTATGVVSLPAASVPTSPPSDYAPLLYDFMPGVDFTPSSTEAQMHQSFMNSVYNYTTQASGTTVSLLVDTSYVVSCYDGSTTNAAFHSAYGSTAQLIAPQGIDGTFGGTIIPFNWSQPQFAFASWTLPVFVQVSQSGTATAMGETYAFARDPSLLPTTSGAPIDWSLVAIATATWSGAGANATLLDLRARGGSTDARANFGSGGGFFNFAQDGAGGWSMSNGQQWYFSYLYMNERDVSGFVRAGMDDYATLGSVEVTNGPNCGQLPGGPAGSGMANPCAQGVETFYYVQLPRTAAPTTTGTLRR